MGTSTVVYYYGHVSVAGWYHCIQTLASPSHDSKPVLLCMQCCSLIGATFAIVSWMIGLLFGEMWADLMSPGKCTAWIINWKQCLNGIVYEWFYVGLILPSFREKVVWANQLFFPSNTDHNKLFWSDASIKCINLMRIFERERGYHLKCGQSSCSVSDLFEILIDLSFTRLELFYNNL